MKKWWIISGVVVVLAVGGFFGYRYFKGKQQAASVANVQTVSLRMGSVTQTIGATGNVSAKQSATLTWQTSGQVAQVNVVAGQQVKAGQVLATLTPLSVSPQILQAQASLYTDQQALNTLLQSDSERANAYNTLVQAQDAYTKANNAVIALKYPRGTTTNDQNAYTTYQLDQAKLAQAQNAYNRVANLPNTDIRKAQALNTLTAAQTAEQQALATYNWLTGKPTAQDVADANAALAVAAANLSDAQRQYNLVQFGPTQGEIQAAQAKVESDQATLSETQITAPFAGTITDVSLQAGDTVSAGTSAFQLTDLSQEYVSLQVSEVDIDNVQVGQPVSFTFAAIPNKTYTGKVTQIDPVGVNSSGVVDYTVNVQITNPDKLVLPGMTASANVVTAQVTNVLVAPSVAIQTVGNRSVVFMLNQGKLQPVVVQVGASSGIETQITSSQLKPGEAIVLNPTSSASAGSGNLGALFRLGGGGAGGNFNRSGGNFNRGGAGGAGSPSSGSGSSGGSNSSSGGAQ
ncbi:MAG: efflux RND transporter periplasmic adaptor subunit [Chloroflexi bacterium]|nr:efflux RND transporter periplasmic adaptor subunit [Chloroflexota bacterium]